MYHERADVRVLENRCFVEAKLQVTQNDREDKV